MPKYKAGLKAIVDASELRAAQQVEPEIIEIPVQEPVVVDEIECDDDETIVITPETLESTNAFKRAKPCQRCFAEPTFSLSDGGELRISCDKCHTYVYGNSIEQALANWNEK